MITGLADYSNDLFENSFTILDKKKIN